jgi:hypothetical protein
VCAIRSRASTWRRSSPWCAIRRPTGIHRIFLDREARKVGQGFLLGGDSGSGKSILAQTWCTCMVAGRFFLGRQVTSHRPP